MELPVEKRSQAMLADNNFEIQVLFHGEAEPIRLWKDYLEQEVSILDSAARLRPRVAFAGGDEELLRRINQLATAGEPSRVIVLSKHFAARTERGDWQATPIVRALRDFFTTDPTNLCGLIAILSDQPHRISDIDAILPGNEIEPSGLKRKLVQVATRMWLKTSVSPQSNMRSGDAIRVRCAQSRAELRKCFELRHTVYDLLGYLEEPVSGATSRIDIDCFDNKAIHFAAIDHRSDEVVGTARLVTTLIPFGGQSAIGNPWRVMRAQGDWTKTIAAEALLNDDAVFHRKLNHPVELPFPLLVNSDFGKKYRAFLEEHPPALGGEVSRVVVSPLYRGFGISALLMRAVIGTAFSLKKRFLLLECVPAHIEMYAKYGFRLIEGHHFRAQDLDQLAVGMSMRLDDHPFNKAVALAKSDVRMLGQSGDLCLCRNIECWKRSGFPLQQSESRCPLLAARRGQNRQVSTG
jgi:predicted GNAT family N-acyltransferase